MAGESKLAVFNADLECVLFLGSVDTSDFCEALRALQAAGATRSEPTWLQGMGGDAEFTSFSDCSQIKGQPDLILGQFLAPHMDFRLSIGWPCDRSAIVLSAPESELVDEAGKGISARSLSVFVGLCASVATHIGAHRIYLGTEAVTHDQMSLEFAAREGLPTPDEAFSDVALQRLRRWYADEYANRWRDS